jgi:hydrogenase nickel incorporation protein HypA/HybF
VAVHELALMESVVAAVVERIGDARVTTVRLEIGRLAAVVPDAMRFCFDLCARGTSLEGATLEICEIAGRARCRACGGERDLESYADLCPCGAADLAVLAGEELRIKNVEVA